jgi:hypothetical protein
MSVPEEQLSMLVTFSHLLKRLQFNFCAFSPFVASALARSFLSKNLSNLEFAVQPRVRCKTFGREKSGKFCPYLQRKFSSHSIKGGFLPQPPFSKNNCGGLDKK